MRLLGMLLRVTLPREPMSVFISSLQDLRSVGAAGACWMHGSQLRRGAMTLAEAVGLRRA